MFPLSLPGPRSAALAALALVVGLAVPPRAAAHDEIDLLLAPLDAALTLTEVFLLAPAVAAPPGYARIDCDVEPEEAEVYLDGRYVGQADDLDGFPSYLWVRPGRYTLRFEYPGRHPLELEIRARPGQEIEIDESLPRAHRRRPHTHLRRGEPPRRVRSHHRRPRHDATPRSTIWKERPADRDDDDSDDEGLIYLTIRPEGAVVYVDGRFVGSAPLPKGGAISLSEGRHNIDVLRPGYRSERFQVEVEEGDTRDLVIELEPH